MKHVIRTAKDTGRKISSLLLCMILVIVWNAAPQTVFADVIPSVSGKTRDVRLDYGLYTSPLDVLGKELRTGSSSISTSTDSLFEANYTALLSGDFGWNRFADLRKTMYVQDSYLIPGINCTNLSKGETTGRMVPQGICTAGNLCLISAYNYTKEQKNSVLYVLDQKTGAYLTTLVLNLKSHVGAVAWDGNEEGYIYIADSNIVDDADGRHTEAPRYQTHVLGKNVESSQYRVWKYPLSLIRQAVELGHDASRIYLSDYVTTSVCPSFVSLYDDVLYVGDFYGNNQDSLIPRRSYMKGIDPSTGKELTGRIPLEYFTQGAGITDYQGKTYLITSRSYGRNKPSYLTVRRLWKLPLIGFVPSPAVTSQIQIPNMSEDIDISGDHLLVNFESASRKYQPGNITQVQLDRVLNVSIASLISRQVILSPYANPEYAMQAGMLGHPLINSDGMVLDSPKFRWRNSCYAEDVMLPDLGYSLDDKNRRGKEKKPDLV